LRRAEPDQPRSLPLDPRARRADRGDDDGVQLPRRPFARSLRPARGGAGVRSPDAAGGAGAAASDRLGGEKRSPDAPLLEVRDLVVEFDTARGVVRAVDGVSLAVERGRTLGLVGESGSGKSVSSLAITRLLDENARIVRGEVRLEGRNLLELSEREMRE